MQNEALSKALERGFIDESIDAKLCLRPQLLVNDRQRNLKILTVLENELTECTEFMFSVAFINERGLFSFLPILKELEDKGIKGKILASQYQNFTEPRALARLKRFSNVELKLVPDSQKMHTKCFIFKRNDSYNIILGSSNLTISALSENNEWDVKFNSSENGELTTSILEQFRSDFDNTPELTQEALDQYAAIFKEARQNRLKELKTSVPNAMIVPNKMQAEALVELDKIRSDGKDRALLISATGSGKTYLSAFDIKRFGGSALYIVHRVNVMERSKKSYETVICNDTVILDRNNLDSRNKLSFATIGFIARDENLQKLDPKRFDYIVIDECHHAQAKSYGKILDYFKPKFWLGMTATPDRMDSTEEANIYKLFDYNIAYNIRIREALEYDLVCPFHYFGISDLRIDGIQDKEFRNFSKIEKEQLVSAIIEKAEFYGYCGDRVKGLIFCSNKDEAEELSQVFNTRKHSSGTRNYRTVAVYSDKKGQVLDEEMDRLVNDDIPDYLDYIISVNQLNEGTDLPAVNQVIMLRPTESPIVYIQQLGRGLRRYRSKEYVVVLDFIGNYESSYTIPLALSDNHSYSKTQMRDYIRNANAYIPGTSTISFDRVAKEKIFHSIDATRFESLKMMRERYTNLKIILMKTPRMIDFINNRTIDPLLFISYFKSYYTAKVNFKDAPEKLLSSEEVKAIEHFSKFIPQGKRRLDIDLLRLVLEGKSDLKSELTSIHSDLSEPEWNNVVSVFNGTFYKNENCMPMPAIEDSQLTKEFRSLLKNETVREELVQLVELGEYHNQTYGKRYKQTQLALYETYSYVDVCRMLNWEGDEHSTMFGYKYDSKTNTLPVFIDEESQYSSTDKLLDTQTLKASSKSNDGKDSKFIKRMTDSSDDIDIHIFMKRKTDLAKVKEFYYLGTAKYCGFENIPGVKAVAITYKLDEEVPRDLFEYLSMNVTESDEI